jgi:uncharacterized PurR-regulated membrane protein YhhQ (DUF165 family)
MCQAKRPALWWWGSIVRAYGFGDPAGGRDSVSRRMAGSDSGYRMRGAADTSWPAYGAYSRRDGVWERIGGAVRAVLRLIVPVATLLLAFAAVYLYLDTPATALVGEAEGRWLSVGHLMLPLCFLAVHLTNRRYGPAYAFAQVVLGLAAAAAFVKFAVPDLRAFMPFKVAPEMREALAFAGGFFAASFVSIVVFDGARGPRWWTAPLFGMLSSALLFCPAYYAMAYAGVQPWTHQMLVLMGLLSGAAVLALIPYWSLRGLVRPLPGYGGY